MQDKAYIKYFNVKSKEYTRAFANTSLATLSPYGDVVIDFCEESLRPILMVDRPLEVKDQSEINFSHKPNEILVDREMKFSVTMNRDQALLLAQWIFENCGDEDEGGET